MRRDTLYHDDSKGNMAFETWGSAAVGPVLMAAGASEEHFNVLADPDAVRQVVELLAKLNADRPTPQSTN